LRVNMVEKIYDLLNGFEIPILALNDNDEIIYANEHFKSEFLSKNSIEFKSINQLNDDWVRVNFDNDLIIINKSNFTFLYSVKIVGFYDYDISDDYYIKVYNFDITNDEHIVNPIDFFNLPKESKVNYFEKANLLKSSLDSNIYSKQIDNNDFGKDMMKIENDKFVFNVTNFAFLKGQLFDLIRDNVSDDIAKKIVIQIQIYCIQIVNYFNKRLIYLNDTECKVILYSIFNLSTKEISEIEKKSDRTIQNAKYILRKKFGLKRNQLIKDIINFEIR